MGARVSGVSCTSFAGSSGSVFVTTPNRWFPLEVHTLLPFVHWLPGRARARRVIPFDDVLDPLGPEGLRLALSLQRAGNEHRA